MLAFTNGKIYTMAGRTSAPPLTNGTVIIGDDGKISGLGENLPPPAGCRTFDVGGRLITPGLVEAHSHIGLFEDNIGFPFADANEGFDPITPHMRAIDGINFRAETFADARKAGITTLACGPGSSNVVGGTFLALKPHGPTIDQMVIKDPLAMKCAFGENPKRNYGERGKSPKTRMAIAAALRDLLRKSRQYWDKKLSAKEPGKRPPFNMKYEAMRPLLDGEIGIKAHCHRADDIITAIRIRDEFGLSMSLEHATEGHLVADQIAAADIPVIFGPSMLSRYKFEYYNRDWQTAVALHDKGVLLAITTDHPPATPFAYLPLCAGYAAKAGLPQEAALAAITCNPAKILGLDDRLGSLAVGKDGDLVVWDDWPLYSLSRVDYTVINGRLVYDRQQEEE